MYLVATNSSDRRKARGAFFTPSAIADHLTSWAVRSPNDRVFEPSCGEAAFLVAAARRLLQLGSTERLAKQLVGVDVHAESVRSARQELDEVYGVAASVGVTDFFDVDAAGSFDAVVGNPPYVRFQNFFGEAREKARVAAEAEGVRLSGLASSWAAFVVHAAAQLKPSGRLALVLPAELLTVNYAAPVRRYLMQRFSSVALILFEERVFPGVLEEVVLLMAEGPGPTDHCELYQARNLHDLETVASRSWTPSDAADKWMEALLPDEAAEIYDKVRRASTFDDLQSWGETNLGMVSGNNKFFALTADRVRSLGLTESDVLRISPPGSRHLRGLTFSKRMWETMLRGGSRCVLFDPDPDSPSPAAQDYIKEGERRGVQDAYKCRVRTPWWIVPKVALPHLFLTYMNHDTPRLVANRARVSYLNSVHGLVLSPSLQQLGMDVLPIAALNSLTLLGAELVGRSYGGGMLKVEPKEADRLSVPSPEFLATAHSSLRTLRPQLARHLRSGDLDSVVELVDKIVLLRGPVRISRNQVEDLRRARRHLFERRVSRTRHATL